MSYFVAAFVFYILLPLGHRNVLIAFPVTVSDLSAPADEITFGRHKQSFKYNRANTTLYKTAISLAGRSAHSLWLCLILH